jgi:hypothetical protein
MVKLFFFLNKKQKSCVISSLCGGAAWSDRRYAPAQPQDKEIWSNITFLYFNKFIFAHSPFLLSLSIKGYRYGVKNEGIADIAVHDALIAIS